jgi:preprotein translocase subunit SecD
MATRGTPSRSAYRPGRPLAAVLLAVLALNAFVALKHWTPRQGLDLVGGTSVILTPKGGKPSSGALNSAVDIIRQRVNGTGVSSAEVVAEGQNVRVSLPNVGRTEALKIVGTTAQLTFRPVIQQIAPGPQTPATATPTPSASGKPGKTPSPKPTPAIKASPTPTAKKRALSEALLGPAASATPTPTASASGDATPSPTPTPSASGSPGALPPLDLQTALQKIDCSDPADRQRVAESFGPPAKDKDEIVSCDADGTSKLILGPAEMTGTDVKSAQATINTGSNGVSTGEWIVQLSFKSARKWSDLTGKYVNKQVAIVLDGLTESAPNINEKITGGSAQISGSFTEKSARSLANVLKYGALPVQFEQSQTQTISPTLGKKSLHGGLLAGILGLGLVLIYALVYYRGLGLVTVLGLLVFGALNYSLVVILGHTIGFTLTLAGIAGLIVSVGISADSYVVFYERLKDEVRDGRSLRQSVERGFTRAFRTILAADFVSFLAAATLYLLSVGEVRGFAFTLGLATLLDVTVAYLFTKPFVTLITRTRLFTEGRFVGIAAGTPAAPKEA